MGITSPVYPYLSLSLGSFEITLLEMVSAFSTFPNKGVRFRPYFITRIEDKDGDLSAVEYGALVTPAKHSTPERLRTLYEGVSNLIERYKPAEVAVELFVARNLKTALMVGQARGVALLAC
jgi:membrane carboxypeptidase/penicillin-binding protein